MNSSSSSRSGWTILIWVVVGALAALWSGAAWILGSLVSLVVETASSTPGGEWASVLKAWEPPPWLQTLGSWMGWGDVAHWQSLALALIQGIDTAWPWLGEVLSWLQPVLVVLWALGLLILLVVGGVVHAWVRWMIRHGQSALPAQARA